MRTKYISSLTDLIDGTSLKNKSENELKEIEKVLSNKIDKGEATVSDANKLATIRKHISRIQDVKFNRS